MTETTTPTDEVVDQSSSDIRDESLLEQDNQESAVERNDTDSSEQDSQDSDTDSSSNENEDERSDEDKGLAKFAKSQGFDPDNLTDGERKALKLAHDNQKAYRKSTEAKGKKVEDEVKDLYKPDSNDDANVVMAKRLARLEVKEVTSEFWKDNEADREYEGKMAEVLKQEREQYGEEAARSLANNLPRLLREAKALAGAYDSDAARDAGRREERERLRKIQEGGSDSAHASDKGSQANSGKIDLNWVENEYDSHNPEHQKLLDAAIQRGDLY